MSASPAPMRPVVACWVLMRAVGQADVVEDVVHLVGGNCLADGSARLRSQRRAVSSMRVPVLARTWRMKEPLSVVGKKFWPRNGMSRKSAEAEQEEDGDEELRAVDETRRGER